MKRYNIKLKLFLLSAFIFISIFMSIKFNTYGEDLSNYNTCYKSIKINYENNDLNIIADQFNTNKNISNTQYIDKIKQINNISEKDIFPGCYIIVECYE